jgi:hypothetical protein
MEIGYLASYKVGKNMQKSVLLDPNDIINLFEVVRAETKGFNIIRVIRNNNGYFNVGDTIYLDHIDKHPIYHTVDACGEMSQFDDNEFFIKKKKTVGFYTREIDDNICKLLKQMEQYKTQYKNTKYDSAINLIKNELSA